MYANTIELIDNISLKFKPDIIMNEKIWWYQQNEQQLGPCSVEEIKSLLQNGTIDNNTLVWKIGMAEWQPMGSINLNSGRTAITTENFTEGFNKGKNILYSLLGSFDNGNFFRRSFHIIYLIQALFFILMPIFLLYQAIDNNIFDAGAKYTFMFIFVFLIITFVALVCCIMWWQRSKIVKNLGSITDEFTATPLISHLIQTIGETYAVFVALGGSLFLLVMTLFGDDQFQRALNLPLGTGFFGMIGCILIGFVILIVTRLWAELLRAVTAIANNTKK